MTERGGFSKQPPRTVVPSKAPSMLVVRPCLFPRSIGASSLWLRLAGRAPPTHGQPGTRENLSVPALPSSYLRS